MTPMSSTVAESPLQRERALEDFGRPERAALYVPRVLQQHLVEAPQRRAWVADGTAVFADVSGFTKLSEALARKGKEGAEQITETIERVFHDLLGVAYERGGSLLKFGGDALLLWFQGDHHAARACGTAFMMRTVLGDIGAIEFPDVSVTLRISQGVHSGRFEFFAIGEAHRELLTVGPGWSRLAASETAADADQILVTSETAAALPEECLGESVAPGRLLCAAPAHVAKMPFMPRPALATETLARCLSGAIRTQVLAGGGGSEHRPVAIAFIKFTGTDALITELGVTGAASSLHETVSLVQAAAEEQDVAFLASDVDADGGKLILTAGAPKATGNDEERLLLALRKIVTSEPPLPLKIGVHRGAVFAGDIGPPYRRTYTVMGDTVNLTARLMAKAEPGSIYATADVLERSDTQFETTELEPFSVKGKAAPVRAWTVGAAKGSKKPNLSLQKLPLTGRNAELGVIRKAFVSARGGEGRLIEVVGEAGTGKTRLIEALRDAAAGFRKIHATCEAYTASTPYAVWRELLRELMEFGRDEPDVAVIDRVRDELGGKAPEMMPWLPLIATALGIELESTPEVAMLADQHRRAKLHESILRFLEIVVPKSCLIEVENAHQMDEASAELLSHVAVELGERPWLFAVARRAVASGGFRAPDSPAVVRIELKTLAPQDALRMAQLATQQSPLPPHVLDVVAKRSGGNPQFLRDLVQKALQSGGVADLPDSAEAAAMAQIDALAPEDRAVVRRAAVFGLTFHPRMLEWFADEGESVPAPAVWDRMRELFDEEADGYLRFRRTLLRDAAYQGLPFKLRRRLHSAIARHLKEELDAPDESAGILSLHHLEAGEIRQAWEYATIAGKRAAAIYAHVEAANLYLRAIAAGKQLDSLSPAELAAVQEALADAWRSAGEFKKASEAYVAARSLRPDEPLADAVLMRKLSYIEEKLGNYTEARRWTQLARDRLASCDGAEEAREMAELTAWHAVLFQCEGKTEEALEWGQRAAEEAAAIDHAGALAEAYFVLGWAQGELGKEGAEDYLQRSLECLKRTGNFFRQAGVLMSLGVVLQWEGRWDEALRHYEDGRVASQKAGDVVGTALARINIAEVLTDRGEWKEAEAMLLEVLPFWKASEYHYYLAACLSLLGRVYLRQGKHDDAVARLEEAKAHFLHVGAEQEVPPVDARIAECWQEMGQPERALDAITGLLSRLDSSTGVARVQSLIQRLHAHSLIQQGDLWGARDALEASLASARAKNHLFELTLTMLSLIELDRLEGVEPPLDMVEESRSWLASFKVRAVPPVPVPAT